MTKTLTEQWRNEELPIDLYYVIDKLGRETIGNDCGIRDMMVDAFNGGNIFIKEVLAPVPSYEEWKELKEQRDWYETRTYERAALINKLREQLKEANEVIKNTPTLDNFYTCFEVEDNAKEARKYLKKWGVK